ncbi:hypothetical protein HOE37_06495 [Candidatus Woesearchaeota archaeon]|jgi:hypothetical protein|nr:hypothetical protein [Candidatus Woesearchaeota archaeon]
MAFYTFNCEEHGYFEVEGTPSTYRECFPGGKSGCPVCNYESDRILDCPEGIVKGGTGTLCKGASYYKGRDENWISKEIEVSKKHQNDLKTDRMSPYATMTPNLDHLTKEGTQNPALKETGLDYRRKTDAEVKNTEKGIQNLNEVARKKSEKQYKPT